MPFNTTLQFIGSIPRTARAFTATLLALSFIGSHTSDLTLIPALVLWHPWTLVTSPFVELGLIELVISLLFLPISLRYFERLWGPLETTKFVLITVVISNIIAVFVNVLQHFLIGLKGHFLWMSYRGLMALQAGILVALTQAIPEHQILLFGALGIRVKRLPMLYVTFSTIMCILGFQSPYILIQFGWLTSWIYLRFYKRTGGDILGGAETWGDRSETFAFVHWFPPILHKPISLISDLVYKICTRIGIVKAYGSDDYEPLPAGGNLSSLPGGARAEAERRRAMALKALDQRLASASAATTAPKTGATPPNGTSSLTAPPAGEATSLENERGADT